MHAGDWIGLASPILLALFALAAKRFITDNVQKLIDPIAVQVAALDVRMDSATTQRQEELGGLKITLASVQATAEATNRQMQSFVPILNGLSLSDGQNRIRIEEITRRVGVVEAEQRQR